MLIMGVPSGVQGQSPWLGGQGALHPEAESIFIINGYSMYILFFPLIHDKCQGHIKPSSSLHIRDTLQVILLD